MPGPRAVPARELGNHASCDSLWVVADYGVVVDLTQWIGKHPGGPANILRLLDSQQRFSFKTHFAQTRMEFENAAQRFLSGDEETMTLTFSKSRANNGLDRDGNPTAVAAAIGDIVLVGRLE